MDTLIIKGASALVHIAMSTKLRLNHIPTQLCFICTKYWLDCINIVIEALLGKLKILGGEKLRKAMDLVEIHQGI